MESQSTAVHYTPEHSEGCEAIHVATWNVAAVNNNPFEYWVAYPNPEYNMLMDGVEDIIFDPGERDVPVKDVFCETMAEQLFEDLRQAKVDHVHDVEAMWQSDFRSRRIIRDFMKDPLLGKKRLISVPDRITNTIRDSLGVDNMRPTVINYSSSDIFTNGDWWAAWRTFMFRTEVELCKGHEVKSVLKLLDPISTAKYPALSAHEELVSIPLQMLCLAIFDAILLHILETVGKDTWLGIRTLLAEAFRAHKDEQVASILGDAYGSCSVVFLQEAASTFSDSEAGKCLSDSFDLLQPAVRERKRNQNSLILVRKGLMINGSASEITNQVLQHAQRHAPNKRTVYLPGDLVVFICDTSSGQQLLLASYHGDTNGLATIPIVQALHEVARTEYPQHLLIVGLDANTYKSQSQDYQGVEDFVEFLESCKLLSCWGDRPDPMCATTCNARTLLQPQLNKAVRRSVCLAHADKNLKDWVLIRADESGRYRVTCENTVRDNTGSMAFVENEIFPTTSFPSDHAVVSTMLRVSRQLS